MRTIFLLSLLLTTTAALNAQDGFKPIFDGKTLEGWDGNPKFWSVQDGTITGRTTPDNPTAGNTFLIWRAGEVADFELKLEYKIVGGNSGIQYRSFEIPDNKWVVGGYQADIDSKDRYSGINYGERFRGILADRGTKSVVKEGAKIEVVGSVGDSDEIQAKIKKEDWNDYHIIASGNHFIHKINGVVTCELTDEDSAARDNGIVALQLHAGPPMTVQFRKVVLKRLSPATNDRSSNRAKKKVVLMAGTQSHGYGAHEHYAGCRLLATSLQQAMYNFEVEVFQNGWPKDKNAFAGADTIVMYCDGGGRHPVLENLEQIDNLADKGVGIVCIHYGVEIPVGDGGEHFLKWIGGYFEANWSVNPHWTANFEQFPEHAITRGVEPFEINDEWYYHMRFREGMQGVTPILTNHPPKSTLTRPDGPHSGNPHVRAAIARGEAQHVAWAAVRLNGGRGFGFTGGHDHWNWGDPNFRKLVLNAIVWTAHGEVPTTGVTDRPVTLAKLEANQGYEPPENFDREAIRKKLNLPPDDQAVEEDDAGEQPQVDDGVSAKSPHAAMVAAAQLKTHRRLKATLFASEPMMYNPTNIDIDHLGRVWVCEVLNYRRFQNKQFPDRIEGDRMLVLEDEDRDGQADKYSTFYQGRDIDSVHGICILPDVEGPGLRALVSAKDSG